MKNIEKISSIKNYLGNIEVFVNDEKDGECISIGSEELWDENCLPCCESDAREYLSDKYGLVGDALDEVISCVATNEWIISDNEVRVYLVNFYETDMASEQGERWGTHVPANTRTSKSEVIEEGCIYLPPCYEYDRETETFSHNGHPCELVTESDGTLELVSSDGIYTLHVH